MLSVDYTKKKTKINPQNKKFLGCPLCHSSKYVVFTSSIPNTKYQVHELYCHGCNVIFSPSNATLPIEIIDS
jgi:transcription elongation factor Elf1